jgi:DNA-binding NarL/FixJ family response regulator
MESSEEKNSVTSPKADIIFILGSRTFAHEALASALQRALCMECHSIATLSEIDCEALHPNMECAILLVDSQEASLEAVFAEVSSFPPLARKSAIVVVFNLSTNSGVERSAFVHGARGFFYKEDSLEHMVKGLRALLEGHLWMSRDILVEFALLGSGKRESPAKEKSLLTAREKQVLALVSVGASNEEIADRLYISPHTVKTHLYNTFKKISVPNRFQAALWAARNL